MQSYNPHRASAHSSNAAPAVIVQYGVLWLWRPLWIGLFCRQTGGGQGCCDVTTDQFFKALHRHWVECHWSVVVETKNVVFIGQGDYSFGFQAGWDSGLCQGLVEDLYEDSSQLICIVLHQASQVFVARPPCGAPIF